MKRISILVIAFLVFSLAPKASADQRAEVSGCQILAASVFTEYRGADGSDFPGFMGPPWPFLFFVAETDPLNYSGGVSVSSAPPMPSSVTMIYYDGWGLYIGPKPAAPLTNWDNAYTFLCDSHTASWTVPPDAFRQIGFPQDIKLIGEILTWSPVPNADDYNIAIFPLDGSGNPFLDDGAITTIGPSSTTSAILPTDLPKGDYAVAIDSRERHPDMQPSDNLNWINRSRYFIKYTPPIVPISGIIDGGGSTAVPTMNEWGFILFAVLIGVSAVTVIRKKYAK